MTGDIDDSNKIGAATLDSEIKSVTIQNENSIAGINNSMRATGVRTFWNLEFFNWPLQIAAFVVDFGIVAQKWSLETGNRRSKKITREISTWKGYKAPMDVGWRSRRLGSGPLEVGGSGSINMSPNGIDIPNLFDKLYDECDVEKFEYSKTNLAVGMKRGTYLDLREGITVNYTCVDSVTYELDMGQKITRRTKENKTVAEEFKVTVYAGGEQNAGEFHEFIKENYALGKAIEVAEETGPTLTMTNKGIEFSVGKTKMTITSEGVEITGNVAIGVDGSSASELSVNGIEFSKHLHDEVNGRPKIFEL